MKLVADEDVDRQIIERLRADGHHVLCIGETALRAVDGVVLDFANQEHRPLVTEDKDFGELMVRQRRLTSGVVLIRLAGLS